MTGVADTTDALTRLSAAKLWLVSTTSPTTCGDLPYLSTPLFALIPVASNAVTALTIDQSWRLYFNPTWVAKTDVPVIAPRLAHRVVHLLVCLEVGDTETQTRALIGQLVKLGANNSLIATEDVDNTLRLSACNLPHVDVSDVEGLKPLALLSREKVLMTQAAVKKLEAWLS